MDTLLGKIEVLREVGSKQLNHPLRDQPRGPGALVLASLVERFVLADVPHVIGAPGEFLLEMLAGDPAEFIVEAVDQQLPDPEIIDEPALFEFVAVTPTLAAQGDQPAGQRPAGPYPHQTATAGKPVAGLDNVVRHETHGFFNCRQHTLGTATIVKLVIEGYLIGLLPECRFLFFGHSSPLLAGVIRG
jgi:hypothetical protein